MKMQFGESIANVLNLHIKLCGCSITTISATDILAGGESISDEDEVDFIRENESQHRYVKVQSCQRVSYYKAFRNLASTDWGNRWTRWEVCELESEDIQEELDGYEDFKTIFRFTPVMTLAIKEISAKLLEDKYLLYLDYKEHVIVGISSNGNTVSFYLGIKDSTVEQSPLNLMQYVDGRIYVRNALDCKWY